MSVEQDRSLADLLSALDGALSGTSAAAAANRTSPAAASAGLDNALQQIAEQSQVMTHAGGAAIALRSGQQTVCRARAGDMAPALGAPINITAGLTGECVRTGQVLVCQDTETDRRVDLEVCRSLGIRALVVMPIVLDNRLVGVFEVFSPRPNVFNSSELEALESMGELVVSVLRPEPAAAELDLAGLAPITVAPDLAPATDAAAKPAFMNADPGDDLVCEAAASQPAPAALPTLSPVSPDEAADAPEVRISRKYLVAAIATLLFVLIWLNWCSHAVSRSASRKAVPASSSPAPVAAAPQTAPATVPNAGEQNQVATSSSTAGAVTAPAASTVAAPPSPTASDSAGSSRGAVVPPADARPRRDEAGPVSQTTASPPKKPQAQKTVTSHASVLPPKTQSSSGNAGTEVALPPPVSALPDSGQQATDLVKSVLENRSSVPPPPGETSADSPAKQSAAREASDSSISAVKRAAAQGRPESQLELAVRYANGDGVPQSYAEALHWFSKAEANGVLPREPAAVDAKERTEAWVLEHMQAPH